MRFPEFCGEWEKVPLSKIATRVTRKNKNNESQLPLTISAQYGLVDQVTFFNKVVASSDMSNYYLLHRGEFAYNKSYSGDYPWGAIKRLDRYDQGALSSLYICFTPTDVIDSDFLVHYFESPKWYREVSNIAGEGARNHGLLNIAVPDFFNTQHCITTNKTEQRKIADFLNLINDRIETQKKVIKDLKKLKYAISKRVFAEMGQHHPVVKLGQLCSIKTGKLDANAMTDNGEFPFFTCAREDYRTDTYAFEGDSLLISGNGDIGIVKRYNGKFNAYQRTYVLQDFIQDIAYVQCFVEHHLPKRVLKEKNVGAMPYIVLSTLSEMPIILPPTCIQNAICKTIGAISEQINVEENILANFELQKQYNLSMMFI